MDLKLFEIALVVALPPSLFSTVIVRQGWGTFWLILLPFIAALFALRLGVTDIADAASRSLVVLAVVVVASSIFAWLKRRKTG